MSEKRKILNALKIKLKDATEKRATARDLLTIKRQIENIKAFY